MQEGETPGASPFCFLAIASANRMAKIRRSNRWRLGFWTVPQQKGL